MLEHVITPGLQPLGPRSFVETAVKLPFVVALNGETWQSTRQTLNRAFEDYLGMYDLVFSQLLGDSVEFLFYVEPEEVEKAKAIIDHIGGK